MINSRLKTRAPLDPAARWARRHPGIVDALLALLLAALLAPSSQKYVADSSLSPAWTAALGAAIVVLHLAMLGRRRLPLVSYGMACVAMLVLTLSPYLEDSNGQAVPGPLLPSALVFFVLLYTSAAQLPPRCAAGCLAAALLGGAAVLVRLSTGNPWWSQVTGQSTGSAWLVLTALIVAGAVGAYSLGRLARTRSAYLAELQDRVRRTQAERIAEAEEAAQDERRRIAREMHDVVSHSLAVMISQAEGGRMLSGATGQPAAAADIAAVFGTISNTGRLAMTDMRAMLGVLRDESDTQAQLVDAEADPTQVQAVMRDLATTDRSPLPDLADLPRLLAQVRSAGCDVSWTEEGDRRSLSPAVELALYRVVQESLTNVVKHGEEGASAQVRLHWCDDQLRVAVTDDGFSRARAPTGRPGQNRQSPGNGLRGMNERLEAVGGSLTVGPVPADEVSDGASSARWRVTAVLPVPSSPIAPRGPVDPRRPIDPREPVT